MQQIAVEKKVRDAEIKRREIERKKRHEELAQERKKSFFEVNRKSPSTNKSEARRSSISPKPIERAHKDRADKEDGELDTTLERSKYDIDGYKDTGKGAPLHNELNDLNALDYEAADDDLLPINKKSESMALAFGVEIKARNADAGPSAHHSKRNDKISSSRSKRSRSRDRDRRHHHSKRNDKVSSSRKSAIAETSKKRNNSKDRSKERSIPSPERVSSR